MNYAFQSTLAFLLIPNLELNKFKYKGGVCVRARRYNSTTHHCNPIGVPWCGNLPSPFHEKVLVWNSLDGFGKLSIARGNRTNAINCLLEVGESDGNRLSKWPEFPECLGRFQNAPDFLELLKNYVTRGRETGGFGL